MSDAPEIAILAQGAMARLEELRRVLERSGFDARILAPPDARLNAWGTKLMLAVAGEDGLAAAHALERHWHEHASEEERAASARVVDLDADELTCPACMATFAKAPRCPECGLNLGYWTRFVAAHRKPTGPPLAGGPGAEGCAARNLVRWRPAPFEIRGTESRAVLHPFVGSRRILPHPACTRPERLARQTTPITNDALRLHRPAPIMTTSKTALVRPVPFDLSDESREQSIEQLQDWLPHLVSLALRLKQAHWNLRGMRFKSVHEQFDEILLDVRTALDDVAERIVTIGGAADGLPETVAAAGGFSSFATGLLTVEQAIETICDDLAVTIRRGRKCIGALGEVDSVSEDLAIGVVGTLEKHHWMLQSQKEL